MLNLYVDRLGLQSEYCSVKATKVWGVTSIGKVQSNTTFILRHCWVKYIFALQLYSFLFKFSYLWMELRLAFKTFR